VQGLPGLAGSMSNQSPYHPTRRCLSPEHLARVQAMVASMGLQRTSWALSTGETTIHKLLAQGAAPVTVERVAMRLDALAAKESA
jgi:hypothetical protein